MPLFLQKNKDKKLTLVTALLFLLLPSLLTALEIGNYAYPYKNPYIATLSAGLLKPDNQDISLKKYRTINYVSPIPERHENDFLSGRKELVYQLYRQNHPAPLVFVQGGVGANIFSGTSSTVAELLWRNGYHVIALPSPLNWNFTYAASQSAVPGVTMEDAKDIYRVMTMTLSASRQLYAIQVTRVGAIGISLGALEMAYIRQLEREQQQLNISRYLLINPPVELRYAAMQIDNFKAVAEQWSEGNVQHLISYAFNKVLEHWKLDIRDASYFDNITGRFKLSEDEIKYLIAYALESSLGDVVYVSELVNRRGILKTPLVQGKLNAREQEAKRFTLGEYLDRMLLPMWNDKRQHVPELGEFEAHTDLITAIADPAEAENIFVFHNMDDFLITDHHITELRRILGSHLLLFPHGGHLGNIWYPDNQALILEVFQPLLASSDTNFRP